MRPKHLEITYYPNNGEPSKTTYARITATRQTHQGSITDIEFPQHPDTTCSSTDVLTLIPAGRFPILRATALGTEAISRIPKNEIPRPVRNRFSRS